MPLVLQCPVSVTLGLLLHASLHFQCMADSYPEPFHQRLGRWAVSENSIDGRDVDGMSGDGDGILVARAQRCC